MPHKDPVKLRAYRRRRIARHTAILDSMKDAPCTDCGNQYPRYVMEWDHARGTKLFNIGSKSYNSPHSKKLQDELAKCDLVCANCHKARTYYRRIGAAA